MLWDYEYEAVCGASTDKAASHLVFDEERVEAMIYNKVCWKHSFRVTFLRKSLGLVTTYLIDEPVAALARTGVDVDRAVALVIPQ